MRKILALALLSVSLAACEPSQTDNSNAINANSSTPAATHAPASPTAEPVAPVKPPLKAGDKVKVTVNGIAADATVVSVDDKAGKVTVKIQGQKEEKTVAITDILSDK